MIINPLQPILLSTQHNIIMTIFVLKILQKCTRRTVLVKKKTFFFQFRTRLNFLVFRSLNYTFSVHLVCCPLNSLLVLVPVLCTLYWFMYLSYVQFTNSCTFPLNRLLVHVPVLSTIYWFMHLSYVKFSCIYLFYIQFNSSCTNSTLKEFIYLSYVHFNSSFTVF